MNEPSYEEQDFNQANDLVKQRQRFSRRPKRMGNILAQLMARKGYAQDQSHSELESIWIEIAGPEWQQNTKVGVIRQGVLEIVVSNSSANQQLNFKKRKLLAELQARLPKNNIKDLRFRTGNVS